MLTHQPTWDDRQQLLKVLFTTEEGDYILNAAWKLVPVPMDCPLSSRLILMQLFHSPGLTGTTTVKQAKGGSRFSWGLKEAARQPTDLSKVNQTRQGTDGSLVPSWKD